MSSSVLSSSRLIALLANGTPPRHAHAIRLFRTADVLICCDGAAAMARTLGREPDFVVGDGDSLSPTDRTALGARFIHVAEQETNDLAKAFRFAVGHFGLPDGSRLVLLGATGRREDHALGNIFRLPGFAATVPEIQLVTDDGIFEIVRDARTFSCRPGDSVSVFAPTPNTKVSSTGLQWPLDGVDLSPLWAGTLNKTQGESFTLRTSSPLLVYRPHAEGI